VKTAPKMVLAEISTGKSGRGLTGFPGVARMYLRVKKHFNRGKNLRIIDVGIH